MHSSIHDSYTTGFKSKMKIEIQQLILFGLNQREQHNNNFAIINQIIIVCLCCCLTIDN